MNKLTTTKKRILAVSLSVRLCDYTHFTAEKTETWSGKADCQHHMATHCSAACSSQAEPSCLPGQQDFLSLGLCPHPFHPLWLS